MEITYYGANCVKIANKKASIVVDDTLQANGKKPITTDKDIVLITNKDLAVKKGGVFVIDCPGDYGVGEVEVAGMPTPLHIDESKHGVLYLVHIDGFSVAVIGHSVASLTEEQIEFLGIVDVLVVPVGGNGYTIDATAAVKLIKEINPKIVIPTHYQDSAVSYEVEQAPLEVFTKLFGVAEFEPLPVLKVKDSNLPEKTQLCVLEVR